MTSIVTGDIIRSRKAGDPEKWMGPLKILFKTLGFEPAVWQFFRGDSFQPEVKNVEDVVIIAIATSFYQPSDLNISGLLSGSNLVLATALVFVTFAAAVIVKASISILLLPMFRREGLKPPERVRYGYLTSPM